MDQSQLTLSQAIKLNRDDETEPEDAFHLVTQVDASIVLFLLLIECQKRTMFVSTCV